MSEERNSYRQIFKATSLFGGAQVFNIIISIIRSKIVAVLLGTTGMGIAGLLSSTIGLIASITNFGLGTSAVKDIAAAHEKQDQQKISTTITVFRRLVWITGIIGTLVALIGAPFLSEFTFGNKKYTLAFIWLSVTLLFSQLTSGQDVLLQGTRKLSQLAKANMAGSFLGLLFSVPIYYVWGINGIVPAMIITSILTMLLAWFYARHIKIEKIKIPFSKTLPYGKGMVKMGFALNFSILIAMATSYFVRIYIGNNGGVSDVGLYNAGFAIIFNYVGLIFSAMATDYYPRLAGVAEDRQKSKEIINHQTEISIIILAPIICVFLVFIKWVVVILYSQEFAAVNGMIHWAALGMFFKAASWSIAFLFIAKGETKIYFWNELIANLYMYVLNVLCYKYWKLDGLGISFMVGYILYLIQVFCIVKYKFGFSFSKQTRNVFLILFTLGVTCFIMVKLIESAWVYIPGVIIIIACTLYSYREMDKRLGIKEVLKSKFKRK